MTKTRIEWTDEVWNPVTGCSKVSQGCKHCYAERVFPRPYPGRAFTDVRTHPERLAAPLHWRKPRRVFVNSMSDLFHEDVPDDFIDEVFAVMARCPQHTFQVLTKRAERMLKYLSEDDLEDRVTDLWREGDQDKEAWSLMMPMKNVWLGVSIEDQESADYRIPLLLQTPAAVRWISAEPLLGPIELGDMLRPGWLDGPNGLETPGLDWIVAGGESGPQARPMHPDWVRSLRDQCAAASVPFFFKQWGEWMPAIVGSGSVKLVFRVSAPHGPMQPQFHHWNNAVITARVGKKAAGRMLDGREHNEYPTRSA